MGRTSPLHCSAQEDATVFVAGRNEEHCHAAGPRDRRGRWDGSRSSSSTWSTRTNGTPQSLTSKSPAGGLHVLMNIVGSNELEHVPGGRHRLLERDLRDQRDRYGARHPDLCAL